MMDIKVKKKLLWAVFFSISFMAFLLLRVDWRHFSIIAGRVNMKSLITSFGLFTLANLVRAFRFHRLDHNTGKKLTRWWKLTQFYNFITATLPGGAGEAATVYVFKRFSMFDLLGAVRILLLTRLMDVFALSALFFFAAMRISSDTSYREAAAWLTGVLFLISAIALLPSSERFAHKLMRSLSGHSKLIMRVSEKFSDLLKAAEEQRGGNSYGITLIQSALIVIVAAVSVHMLLRSFGVDFTPVQSFYCFGVYAVFQIVPIQGVAGIGTQAAWWSLALHIAGYNAPDAIAMGFVLHGTFYLFITLLAFSSVLVWLSEKRKTA